MLTDYDGTLAPIVDDPDRAAPEAGILGVLGDLVARYALVGVVSGRPVAFLRRHLEVPGLVLVGQYGLERWDGTRVVTDASVAPYRDAVAAAATGATVELTPLGVRVEHKGEIAVALHWRERPEAADAARAWAETQARRLGLIPVAGRCVVELRPPVPTDKGRAVDELCAGCRAVLFCGDDLGDVAAFDALERLAAEGTVEVAVRVAVRSAEMPDDLTERADLVADGPPGVLAILGELARRATSARR